MIIHLVMSYINLMQANYLEPKPTFKAIHSEDISVKAYYLGICITRVCLKRQNAGLAFAYEAL